MPLQTVTAISGHATPYPSGRGQSALPRDARARVVFRVDEVDLSG